MNVRVARARPSVPVPAPPKAAPEAGVRSNRKLVRAATDEPSASSRNDLRGPSRPPFRERLRGRWNAMRTRVQSFLERKRKGLVLLGRVALTVVLLQAGLVLYRSVDRYVRNSPEFVIASLTIQGNERVQRADLEQAMGVTIGDNVFARAPEEIEASLEAHPWIAEAHVRRRLPSTFEVQVRERSAVLLLALGASYLVDEDGTVFKALDAADPVDLPVITGVEESRFRSDRSYRTELLTSAIALTTEWSLAGLMRREGIAEIHIEPNEEITLFVGDDGTEVRLGRGPYRAKLLRFRRVMDELQRRQSRPLYVYLDNVRRPDRVTVRVR